VLRIKGVFTQSDIFDGSDILSEFVHEIGSEDGSRAGLPDGLFQTKNPNLGKFWRVLLWKILAYFMTIWSKLRTLEIFYVHLVYFVVIWYIFPRFGILDQEKSGNPGAEIGSILFFVVLHNLSDCENRP
jgi:hypothetical protein